MNKDISRKSVLTEARFYLIEGLIELLEQEESNELIEKHILKDDLRFDGYVFPFLRDTVLISLKILCWYNASHRHSLFAERPNRLYSGWQLLRQHDSVSPSLDNTKSLEATWIGVTRSFYSFFSSLLSSFPPCLIYLPSQSRKYASFVNRFVRRGRYWTEGCALKITMTQDEDDAVLGVVARGGLDLYVMHTPPIFNKHQFTLWHREQHTNDPDWKIRYLFIRHATFWIAKLHFSVVI